MVGSAVAPRFDCRLLLGHVQQGCHDAVELAAHRADAGLEGAVERCRADGEGIGARLRQDDLAHGQLAAPFGFVPDNTSYHLLSIRPPDQDERIAVLLHWLRSQAATLADE